MKIKLRPLLTACCLALPFLSNAKKEEGLQRPKLVVGIVVDQMRWDYLYRYYNRYTDGGFRRLLGKGYSCQQTFINYLPSFTAPGHTCIFTGSIPAIHGIAGNDWLDEAGRWTYCTQDRTVQPVGGSIRAGQMSPRNLLTSTVTDELRLATNFHSRVFGVSLKDRASILPAGHLANGAFWFDDSTGNFMTSTYYTNRLPGWLNRFNNRHVPDSFLKANWYPLYDLKSYTQSIPDSNGYEGMNFGEKSPSFPHITAGFAGKNDDVLRRTPGGNSTTLMLAKACIDGEYLGQEESTDFLTINLASTDYVGHQYSPNSIEVEDVYLRLDQDLAAFLNYLDETVGKNQYLIFLTADHGAAHNSIYLNDHNLPSGNYSEAQMAKDLNAFLKKETGKDSIVKGMENYQVYMDESRIPGSFTDKLMVHEMILQWLRKQPQVEFAIDLGLSAINATPEPIHQMAVNGYFKGRSGSIQVIPRPGWYAGYAPTGTTHGTWNPYDTHIPLLWYGWHIPHGESEEKVYMTDIAATVAALLHIQMPNGCIGTPIKQLFSKN